MLQSLLCGPTLDVSSIVPLLEQLPDVDNTGLSVHVLCATKLGQHENAIEKLLDRCPQAIIAYANQELHSNKMVHGYGFCSHSYVIGKWLYKSKNRLISSFICCGSWWFTFNLNQDAFGLILYDCSVQVLWWQKLFPELCERTRLSEGDNDVLMNALKGSHFLYFLGIY